jgi:hypothetical protein
MIFELLLEIRGRTEFTNTSRLLPAKSSAGILPASPTDAGWKPALLGAPKQKTMVRHARQRE